MPKRVRFSLNRFVEPTIPDGAAQVRYGLVEGETLFETRTPWAEEKGAAFRLADVRLLPPCWPSKIVGVGRNYREHASELGNPVPAEPLIFLKPPSAVAAHGDHIIYPAISERVDFEGELGVVIGRRARFVRPQEAENYVLGYTCVNDVTARDLQRKDGQFTRGKGFDTFCPVGPWIVPRGEVDFERLHLRTLVNGQVRQDASIQEMIFPVGAIIAFVTQFMTLEPWDLIATGTPAGVGPLAPGDVVRVEIDGVGALENRVQRG